MLAGVRNGVGFAGCDLGDGFNPISKPKGLPNDLSLALRFLHDKDGLLGDHSFSYLTAQELKDYDWKQTTKSRGYVSEKEYKLFKKEGKPHGHCGDVDGLMIIKVSNRQMDRIISGKTKRRKGKEYYTQIEWEVKYQDEMNWDTYYLLINLKDLIAWRKHKKIKNVRIVFGFDS